jgi:glutamate-5-semialdehyde dehydrogenase
MRSGGEDGISGMALRAKDAARRLRATTTERKDAALGAIAAKLEERAAEVLAVNRADVEDARAAGLSAPMLRRLALDEKGLCGIAAAVREVAALPDPVGEVLERSTRPNGIRVARVRAPLGVVAMIYEARPNVTIDAAALCLKSGNAAILRGGAEALRTNLALAAILREGARASGLPEDFAQVVPRADREDVRRIVELDGLVDVAIPRGGEGLIRAVSEHARVPVLRHWKGVCHVFVDRAADLEMARRIVVNGKVQNCATCNATECLLVHCDVAEAFVPVVTRDLAAHGVVIRADEAAYGEEFLDLVLALRIVGSLDEALDHIARYGTNHTESIVTRDEAAARRFLREVDASCVLWNASTRLNDGGVLGLGAEIGISTTKLHAYGPMGLRELTTVKFIVEGEGQLR